MTQKELADTINISDRTVSKWERGLGCPDVSLLHELSEVFGVNIEQILTGNLSPNDKEAGNMRTVKFYVCLTCGNVLFSIGRADISCCGRKLAALSKETPGECHKMIVEEIENDYYVAIGHEMSKSHYISFVAFVGYDRVLLVKLYPEQNAELRFPKMHGNRFYAYCSRHGLWEHK